MRRALIWLGAVYVFGCFYVMIEQKESLRRNGLTIYLALAPVDPRSPLQGDYMALTYDVTNAVAKIQSDNQAVDLPTHGTLVVALDDKSVGHFVRIFKGSALAPGEHLLKYYRPHWDFTIGAENYFIPEGSGEAFAKAAYGELKVSPDGTPILIALCDKDRQRIPVP